MLSYLQPVLLRHDAHVVDEFILEFFADIEPQLQEPNRSYRSVLQEVISRLGGRLGFTPSEDEIEGFVASIAQAPAYVDSVTSLDRLARSFDLAVVSNTDPDLFQVTAETLGVTFRNVVTAGDVGAYKPDEKMFSALIGALPAETSVLHVAQSLFHDIEPASSLGLDTVHITRGNSEVSAVRPADAEATWTFESLAEFTDCILESATSS